MKIVHIQGRFIISNLQDKLEREVMKLHAEGYEIKQVINNFPCFSILSLIAGLIAGTIKAYTVIAVKK